MPKIKLSVVCITYNHASFIRQTLDGFVTQKTNFPFEVIIHDDASTDGTADIIREYAKKYPNIIKPILQSKNQLSQGVHILAEYLWPAVRGEYVAVCDGDDYWTDPYKLQRQVDFLDAHPDYSLCFHPVVFFWEGNNTSKFVYPNKKDVRDLSLDTFMKQNYIPNCSVVYRWNPRVRDIVKSLPGHIYPWDWFIHLVHARDGKIGFIPDVMARYRRHSGGVSFEFESGDDLLNLRHGLGILNFFLAVEKNVAPDPKKYHPFVCGKAREILASYTGHGDFDSAKRILELCPDLFETKNMDVIKLKKYQHLFKITLVIAIVELLLIIAGFITRISV